MSEEIDNIFYELNIKGWGESVDVIQDYITNLQQENKQLKERINKAIELTKNLLKTEDRGYYQILFKEQLKTLGDKENE